MQNDTNAMMGRKRGVFASLLNSFSSGSVILSMADAANSIVHNDGVAVAVPIVVSLAVYLFVWLFVQQTYRVVMMRMLLEGRTYDKLPVSRFLYPITTRKWLSMAKVMLLENVFLFLWTFTTSSARSSNRIPTVWCPTSSPKIRISGHGRPSACPGA